MSVSHLIDLRGKLACGDLGRGLGWVGVGR
jgi:hypothetical protein